VRQIDFSTASIETVHHGVQESLGDFYRDHIYPHPDRTPKSIYLEILVGIWLRGEMRLYKAHETVLNPISQYECIGSGAYLAKYLIQQYLKANGEHMDSKDAELMAAFAVRSAIEHDESCGGTPEMLTITNNGTVSGPTPVRNESFQFVDGISSLVWQFELALGMRTP
jgi:hypothetical protein